MAIISNIAVQMSALPTSALGTSCMAALKSKPPQASQAGRFQACAPPSARAARRLSPTVPPAASLQPTPPAATQQGLLAPVGVLCVLHESCVQHRAIVFKIHQRSQRYRRRQCLQISSPAGPAQQRLTSPAHLGHHHEPAAKALQSLPPAGVVDGATQARCLSRTAAPNPETAVFPWKVEVWLLQEQAPSATLEAGPAIRPQAAAHAPKAAALPAMVEVWRLQAPAPRATLKA